MSEGEFLPNEQDTDKSGPQSQETPYGHETKQEAEVWLDSVVVSVRWDVRYMVS